jgi:hypothetical protein
MAADVAPDKEPDDDSIEYYILDLVLLSDLPERAVTVCAERYAEAGPYLRTALERFADSKEKAEETGLGLFRTLHIMGGVRDKQAFMPLLRLLRRPQHDLDWLLGDAVTETLPRILIGTFDGHADALLDAIADPERDDLVRDSLLRAATFLAWEGRLDRSRLAAFLERFWSDQLAAEGEFVWNGWVNAIALLGLRNLEPLVVQAQGRDLFDEVIFDRGKFYAELERAEREPADLSRFSDADLGYLDDALDALRLFPDTDSEEGEDSVKWADPDEATGHQPVIDPWRHVGRNHPCPCGSGKKAKRCCLAA